jgi:hypothetical protein
MPGVQLGSPETQMRIPTRRLTSRRRLSAARLEKVHSQEARVWEAAPARPLMSAGRLQAEPALVHQYLRRPEDQKCPCRR